MPIPQLSLVGGSDINELIESLEKQRKQLDWLLQSLDTKNIKELNAEVINAGVINAKHISIGSETTYETGYSPGDIRTEMETQFEVIDGQIIARVLKTDFNALGQRVSTAESSLSVLPGQIESKVSETDYNGNTIASLINQTAANITISAEALDLMGIVRVADSIELGATGNGATKAIKFNGTAAWLYSSGNNLTVDASYFLVQARAEFYSTVDLSNASQVIWGSHAPTYAQSAGNADTLDGFSSGDFSFSGHEHSGSSYVKPSSGQSITLGASGSGLNVYVSGSLMGTVPYA